MSDHHFGLLKLLSEFAVLLGFPVWQYFAVCRDQRRAREAVAPAGGD